MFIPVCAKRTTAAPLAGNRAPVQKARDRPPEHWAVVAINAGMSTEEKNMTTARVSVTLACQVPSPRPTAAHRRRRKRIENRRRPDMPAIRPRQNGGAKRVKDALQSSTAGKQN